MIHEQAPLPPEHVPDAFSGMALILIGFQNDYFDREGILNGVIEASARKVNTLANTVNLIDALKDTSTLIISTPIIFTPDYRELAEAVGILKTIKELGAFDKTSEGSKTIGDIMAFRDFIVEIPGKRGLNAFSNTKLDEVLRAYGIDQVVFAGAVTSICIDSTARAAHERGYKVTILSDCTSARTVFEQDFYCQEVFPLYAEVTDHVSLLESLSTTPV